MTLADYLNAPGRTLTEWAKLAGVSVPTVSRWAAGKTRPNVLQARRVAQATGLPLHVLRPDIWTTEEAA